MRVELVNADSLTGAAIAEGRLVFTSASGATIDSGPVSGFTATVPLVGWSSHPIGADFATTGTGTLTSGRLALVPHLVGPSSWTTNSMTVSVSTPAVGGAFLLSTAVYADMGTGFPDLGSLLATGMTNTLSTAGSTTIPFSAPTLLEPGRVWVGTLLVTTTPPTTAPVFKTFGATTWNLPTASAAPGQTSRAYAVGGLSALPTAALSTSSLGSSTGIDVPLFTLQRSA